MTPETPPRLAIVRSDAGVAAETERIAALPYRRELMPNEDGSWFARIVELRGCMTEGDTPIDALKNIEDALREWLRMQIEDGTPFPQPLTERHYSGKFVVRISSTLHREISERALREGSSLNAFVASALARAVGAPSA